MSPVTVIWQQLYTSLLIFPEHKGHFVLDKFQNWISGVMKTILPLNIIAINSLARLRSRIAAFEKP